MTDSSPPARKITATLLALAGIALVAGGIVVWSVRKGTGHSMPLWPDSQESRLKALVALQTLNIRLLEQPSATLTLEHWCAEHHLADPPTIVSIVDRKADAPPPLHYRDRLQLHDTETIRYRRVQMMCGPHVLSHAENWYVPERLTPRMNHELETTTRPFGKVVASLGFYRQLVSSTLLWSPLEESPPIYQTDPAGPDSDPTAPVPFTPTPGMAHDAGGQHGQPMRETLPPTSIADHLVMPPDLIRNRAVLRDSNGQAFSEVIETYTSKILSFAPDLGVTPDLSSETAIPP